MRRLTDKREGERLAIDVVIPNFNYGRYLAACADSVLQQSGVDVRLLIIDNASTDNSREVANELAAGDARVELLLRPKISAPCLVQ